MEARLIRLYLHPNMPAHWIGINTKTDEAWLIPAVAKGWHQKRPFLGYRDKLEPAPAHCGFFLGVPRS